MTEEVITPNAEIPITFLPAARNETQNFNVWKPFMMKFCKDNGIKKIFVGQGDYSANTESDTVYIYCSHRDMNFNSLASKTINTKLTQNQGQFVGGSGNRYFHALKIYDLKGYYICFYIPAINSFTFADIINDTQGTSSLDDITAAIQEGCFLTNINETEVSAQINIVKSIDVKPFIDPIVKNMNNVFKNNLAKIREDNKNFYENSLSKMIALPLNITDSRVRYMKFSYNGYNGLGIMYPWRFKLKRIVRGSEQYEVSSLTQNHDIMVVVIVDFNFLVKSIKLYSKSMLREFKHLHRRGCNYDSSYEVCLGTYQDKLFKTKIENDQQLLDVLEKVNEIISTVTYGDIAGQSDDMNDEYILFKKIVERNSGEKEYLEYQKYMIGEAWTVKEE